MHSSHTNISHQYVHLDVTDFSQIKQQRKTNIGDNETFIWEIMNSENKTLRKLKIPILYAVCLSCTGGPCVRIYRYTYPVNKLHLVKLKLCLVVLSRHLLCHVFKHLASRYSYTPTINHF